MPWTVSTLAEVGTAIGNGRLISDDGQHVTIRYKDYTAGDIKTRTIPGPQFVQLLCLHILPRGLLRVRYCGLFSTCGRDARLEHCRQTIGIAAETNIDLTERTNSCDDPVLPELKEEGDQPVTTLCTCRFCQAELTVVGRLKANPTVRLMALARSMLPVLAQLCGWVTDELLSQLRSGTGGQRGQSTLRWQQGSSHVVREKRLLGFRGNGERFRGSNVRISKLAGTLTGLRQIGASCGGHF